MFTPTSTLLVPVELMVLNPMELMVLNSVEPMVLISVELMLLNSVELMVLNSAELMVLNSVELMVLNSAELMVLNSVELMVLNSVELMVLNSVELMVLNSAELMVLNSVELMVLNSVELMVLNSVELMTDMSFSSLIAKKRDGLELEDGEIDRFVNGVVNGSISEAQLGAMLMAIYCKGLSGQEIATLTATMKNSGDTLNWPSEWADQLVDKHSTGGVGDKISLVLAPALAAFGVKVPMVSGRGLAHTGGTLDKLEAIRGFKVSLTAEEMTTALSFVGCFIAGQTERFCPADKKMYAIRDVTATVDEMGLITASIVSKKAAENIKALVLDVKTGSGAVMTDERKAEALADSMLSCCHRLGIRAAALMTDMDTPIGNMVGNALEVIESIRCLQGQGPDDLLNLTVSLGGHLLYAGGLVGSLDEAFQKLRLQIENGAALAKFCAMLKHQGVEPQLADDLCNRNIDPRTKLPRAESTTSFQSLEKGFIKRIDAKKIADVSHLLGAGRTVDGGRINYAVGIELLLKPGDPISKGQDWVKVHHDQPLTDNIKEMIEDSLEVSKEPVQRQNTRVQKVKIPQL
ncbi:hypothetical protein Btru_000312 [Bulinus truncatus]|nr:hypothetical protein Btru_000312 [Bulinus truncatus]